MKNKLDAEIIVVGAGPAGVSIAKVLVENGISTLVLDKSEFPRRKACAGGITPQGMREFPFIKDFIDTNIYSMVIHSTDLLSSVDVSVEDQDKPLIGMTKNRTDFDHKMFDMLSTMECKIYAGEKVINIKVNKTHASIFTESGKKLNCLAIIGADSVFSIVAKNCGIGLYNPKQKFNKLEDLSTSIEREVRFDNSGKGNKDLRDPLSIQLFFHYNGLKGYAWTFPRSTGINIGVVGLMNQGHILKESSRKFEQFLVDKNYLPKSNDEDREIETSKYAGAVLPSFKPYKDLVTDRVVLVGDAGGFCSATTGEGIYYSMKSGKIAGDVLVKLVKDYREKKEMGVNQEVLSQIFTKKALKKFPARVNKSIGKELKLHYRVKNFLFQKRNFDKVVKWSLNDHKIAILLVNFIIGEVKPKTFLIKMAYRYVKLKLGFSSKES